MVQDASLDGLVREAFKAHFPRDRAATGAPEWRRTCFERAAAALLDYLWAAVCFALPVRVRRPDH
jgi:hypothetical protein